jgi:hypothetical protein
MRQIFFESENLSVKKLKKVWAEKFPWAVKMVKVEGGYMAFKFITDWLIWKNQK